MFTNKDIERFNSKYIKNLYTGCWEWNAYKDRDGYGSFQLNSYPISAHRAAYLFFVGKIPSRQYVCHTCDNPGCVNPKHLFIGNNSDNMQDMLSKGRGNFAKGSKVGNAKLTEEQVKYIKQKLSQYTQQQLAEEFGVSRALISYIKTNKIWKHVSSY